MMVIAVPVKDLVNAKQRLMSALSPDERRDLAKAMLRDVLRALVPMTEIGLDFVWVVSRDPEVRRIVEGFHRPLLLVEEEDNGGHTAAVALAQRVAAEQGVDLFGTVPGDVPCLDSDEISRLVLAAAELRSQNGLAAVFVPSRSGLGTNAVALAPPDVLPLSFGEPSFDRHLATARELGVATRVLRFPGLGLDIDDPDDLRALLAEGGATESGRLLARWNIAARIPASRTGSARATREPS